MRAGVYSGKEIVKVHEDWPEPKLSPGEVLIRVRYAGICGTDMMIYSGKHPRVMPPRVLGHEIFGSVVESEAVGGSEWPEGARVAIYPLISCGACDPCREGAAYVCEKLGLIGIDVDGGFAEYVKANASQLVAVPETVSDEQAALIEPLSVAVHAVRHSGFKPGDTVAVTGAGPIGNLVAQVLRAYGARGVIVSETQPFRRHTMEQLGFTAVNPLEESLLEGLRRVLGEDHVDRVFEATGAAASYPDAVRACRVRGEIVLVGIPKSPPQVDVLKLVFKELKMTGVRVYERSDYLCAISLLEHGGVDVGAVITDRLRLESLELGFRSMLKADSSLKIIFQLY